MLPAFNGLIYEGTFTNICSLFPSPNFTIMIFTTQVACFQKSSLKVFQARPPINVLKRAHIRAINLRYAKVSQRDSFILFANLAALFYTRFKTLIPPSM